MKTSKYQTPNSNCDVDTDNDNDMDWLSDKGTAEQVTKKIPRRSIGLLIKQG
jgi:hypothetical protein